MPEPIFKSKLKSSVARFFTTAVDSFSPGTLTASDVKADLCGNENIRIFAGPESCSLVGDIWAIAEILDPIYEISEEYYENGFGKRRLKSRLNIPRMQVRFTADTFVRSRLMKVISENEFLRMDFETAFPNKIISNISVAEEQINLLGGVCWNITLSFEVAGLDITGTTPCCSESVFSEAPYVSDCPEEPLDPDACDLMSIGLSESSGTISLTITNPFGSPTSEWTYTPTGGVETLIGTNINSVVAPGYGVYRVRVESQGCVKTATIAYLDPCAGFTVSISVNNGVLTATVDAAHDPADALQWEYSADGISWSNLGTSNTQAASSGEGYYRVEATDGTCETSDMIFLEDDTICSFTGTFAKVGNDITWTIDSGTVVAYSWDVDLGDGNGFVPMTGETTDTITAEETGNYRVTVELDNGCIMTFDILHIVCGDCATFGATVTNAGDLISVTVDGCSDETYEWYEVNPDGTKDLLPVTIDEYTLPGDGLYFVVICCKDCTPKVFLISKVGGTIIITDNSLSGGFAWGGAG